MINNQKSKANSGEPMNSTQERLLSSRRLLIAGSVIVVGYILWNIGKADLTPRESTLLGIMLTIFSSLGGWLVTHIYANRDKMAEIQAVEEKNRANLRMYALKAAEKVNNLSNELERLSIYLQTELESSDYQTESEELHGKEERIESAIHLLRTLKSVNDTSLSDWQGVIGDELEEQKQRYEDQKEELSELVSRLEPLLQARLPNQAQDSISAEEFRLLRSELRTGLLKLGAPISISKPDRASEKSTVELDCPICSEKLKFRQRQVTGNIKAVVCKHCKAKFVSRFTQDHGSRLEPQLAIKEQLECSKCKGINTIEVDNLPGRGVNFTCECGTILRGTRTSKGPVTVTQIYLRSDRGICTPTLTEELISKIKHELPSQPWPTGVHKLVADSLGIPPSTVSRAIKELIKREEFKDQINGELIEHA